MAQRKFATLLIALVLLLGIVPASAGAASPPAETNAPTATDTIAIRPQTKSVLAGDTFTLDVKVEGSTPVVSGDFQIMFDTQYLEGVSVTNSGVLNSYFIDNSNLASGKVLFGAGNLTSPQTPPFTVATLTLKAKQRLGTTNLTFDPTETQIEAVGGAYITGSLVNGSVTIGPPTDKDIVAIRPSTKMVTAGQSFAVDVNIEGPLPTRSADVQILFDPARLEAVNIVNSGSFPELIDNSDFASGKIWFGGGILGSSVTPNFTFATIVFKAKQTLGPTNLVFNLSETSIEDVNGVHILGGVQDAVITVGGLPDGDIVRISPSSKTVATDETFTVDVVIEGPEKVVASDVQILFDTTYLEGISVTNSGLFNSYFITNNDLPNGKFWFGAGTFGTLTPPFTYATLTFKAKQKLGTTDLKFNVSEVYIEGEWGSVFGGAVDGQVTVGKPNVSLVPSAPTVVGCTPTTVDIVLNQVTNVKSADITLTFDPTKLYVIDADSNTAGTQIVPLNGFLKPDTVTANLACNTGDAGCTVGTIHFAATQAVAPWATGSGSIARISFHPVADGTSNLTITNSQVLNDSGTTIVHTQTNTSPTGTALGAPVVGISKIGLTTARLSWGAISLAQAYQVYRRTAPYYTAAGTVYGTTTALQLDDGSALGSTLAEYYYYVKGACSDGFSPSVQSNHVGAFDFDLIKGN